MKAYMVGLNSNPDAGNEIVFASTAKEAHKFAYDNCLPDDCESWVDVYAKRSAEFDGLERLPKKELELKKFREGWWWFNEDDIPIDDCTDQEFYDWWGNR